jgi:hypothetical protein
MRSSAMPSPRQRHWLTASSRNGGNSFIANAVRRGGFWRRSDRPFRTPP